jgi:hypothetical protein
VAVAGHALAYHAPVLHRQTTTTKLWPGANQLGYAMSKTR